MTFANVKLIVAREIRDQLRDRRTLFVIVVLPMLLYPLLGMSLFQVSQFLREQPVHVLVVGAENLSDLPPLLGDDDRFSTTLFDDPGRARLLQLDFLSPSDAKANPRQRADEKVKASECDVALYFPPDFHTRAKAFRDAVAQKRTDPATMKTDGEIAVTPSDIPSPEIIFTTANEKSQIALRRLSDVMQRWTQAIGESTLTKAGLPVIAVRPFTVNQADVARGTSVSGAAGWAKILPVMLLLWALTGAFYPAIDLCAGEKERGTLETLLSSPAERSEIVVGKLLTIMIFSALTAVLNLASVAFTGWLVLSQFPNLGPPPVTALLWISLALLPVVALFSAVCLALAAFARSSKEGQYYLMPVLLITMPLVVLPMSPGAQLNLGYSLIPVTGIVLLLKSLLEGNYLAALQYAPVVIGVTFVACLLAVRWAIDQFNTESVLFSGSERFDLRLWLRHLYVDRKPTPTVAGAVFCAASILMLKFLLGLAVVPDKSMAGFLKAVLVPQLAVILLPVLILAFVFTSKPRETLLLKFPRWSWWTIPAAVALAVTVHPLMAMVRDAVTTLYPIDQEMAKEMQWLRAIFQKGNLGLLLLLVGVTPAICEELATRGFVLSGLRHLGYKWRAIVLSAVFFGMIHLILQQSINAFFVGVILGYLAVQSGSIFPCMAFHFTYNSLTILAGRITVSSELYERWPVLKWMIAPTDDGFAYRWPLILAGGVIAVLLVFFFSLLPHGKTDEERLRDAIVRATDNNPEEKEISASMASMID